MVHLQAEENRRHSKARVGVMHSTMKVSEFQHERRREKASINMKVIEQQSLLYLFLPAHHGLQILIHESKLLLQLSDSTGLVQHEQGIGGEEGATNMVYPGVGCIGACI